MVKNEYHEHPGRLSVPYTLAWSEASRGHMIKRFLAIGSVVAVTAFTAACQKASPTRPTDVETASASPESVTDARTGATIVAARPAAPANNAEIRWTAQPITLAVGNAVSTGSSALSYTFEVAGDAAFTRKDVTRDNVAPGADGTTNVSLPQLGGSRTYYWRVLVSTGSGAGPVSAVRTFSVGPEIVLGTPVPAAPVNGAPGFAPLSLVINNVSRSGPNGSLTYRVEVASDQGFGTVLFSTDAPEQGSAGGQTTVSAAVSGLAPGTTYYWRARVSDVANGITTPYSAAASFVAQTFNFRSARIWDNPRDLGSWPVAARITSIEFTGGAMRVEFDRRTGANRWPDVVPPGWNGPIQYTLGLCLNINNQWNCSAVVLFWPGRDLNDSGPPSTFWYEWWYAPDRWGPMVFYRPREGETVGVFVAAGELRGRDFALPTCPRVCEVSNVALVPWTTGSATYINP